MAGAPTLSYWFSTASPWAWLGSARFADLAARFGAVVEVLPVDLSQVFESTGGLPFHERAPARRSYRQLELDRWSRKLGIPIRLEPRYYPVDRGPSSRLLLAASRAGQDALSLSHAILRAIWAEDRDISSATELARIADAAGLDGKQLVAQAADEEVHQRYAALTQRAIEEQIFGSPTYVFAGERFWGQDRLEMLSVAIKRSAV